MCESIVVVGAALSADVDAPTERVHSAPGARRGQSPKQVTGERAGRENAGWSGETPLWYYILREADVREAGDRLGPVGSRSVGEVLIGLLDLDPGSVRHAPPSWKSSATLIELLIGLDHMPVSIVSQGGELES